MQNFYKFYRLLLEANRSWEGYFVPRLGKNAFLNILQSDSYNENDALKDSQELYEKFVKFGFKHNNRSKKLFKPAVQIIANLILSGKTRDELYQENGQVDKILSKLQEVLNNSIFLTDFTKNPNNIWNYEKFENFISQIEQTKAEKNKKAMPITQNENYKLIPIKSFEEFQKRYGNKKTGYKGDSGWCTVQNESTYKSYLKKSKNANFFVLEKKGWENINPGDNLKGEYLNFHNPYDEYGLSLICLVVDLETLNLDSVVLRWNHLGDFDTAKTGIPNGGGDNAFISYDDMSKVLGFDFKNELLKQIEKIKKFKEAERLRIEQERLNKIKYQVFFQGTFIEKLQDIANNPPYILKKDYIEYDFIEPENQKYFENLKIPNGIKEIGSGTFYELKKLKSVELPDSLIKLGEWCFAHCWNLESVKFPINSDFKEIPNICFDGCNKLKSIEIPDSIETIGEKCFARCENLETVKFPINPNFKKIPKGCFWSNKNLKSIEIPDSVIILEEFCFSECENLEMVKFPNNFNFKIILRGCFVECESLKSLEIPDSVEEIGYICFSGCKNLESIKLPNNPNFIELPWNCFSGCENLKILKIPKNIIILNDWSIHDCEKLEKVIILGNIKDFKSQKVFDKCPSLKEIICKEESTYNKFKEKLNLENVDISLDENIK